MLLCIDTGNTQTVIGLFDGKELVDHWRIASVAERTADELALMIQQFLGFHGFSPFLVGALSAAATGVEFVSVGALTHSAPALDIALDIEPESE